MNKIVFGVCTLLELAGITALTGIALKRNNDCYKAEMELIDVQHKLLVSEIQCLGQECEIDILKKDIEKLKAGES